jgi:hypothetical protein
MTYSRDRKFQIPTSDIQKSSRSQAPNETGLRASWNEFGISNSAAPWGIPFKSKRDPPARSAAVPPGPAAAHSHSQRQVSLATLNQSWKSKSRAEAFSPNAQNCLNLRDVCANVHTLKVSKTITIRQLKRGTPGARFGAGKGVADQEDQTKIDSYRSGKPKLQTLDLHM